MRTQFTLYIQEQLGQTAAEVFELNQLLLPQQERVCDGLLCKSQQGGYTCMLAPKHNGQHIAHNLLGNIVHRWDW